MDYRMQDRRNHELDWRTLVRGQRLTPRAVLDLCLSLHGDDPVIYEEGGIADMILDANVFVYGSVEVSAVERSIHTDDDTVARYAARIEADGICPPIIVDWLDTTKNTGRLIALDGNHRLDALALIGWQMAPALIAERH
jgi:hypothetical protein